MATGFGLQFDTQYFRDFVFSPPSSLLQGLVVTVVAAVTSELIGVMLGVLLGVAGLARSPVLRVGNQIYIWFFRGTPVLVQLMLMYFGLPYLFGFDMFPDSIDFGLFQISGAVLAGVLTFGLHEAAYMSEISRSGIQSIDRGQAEAAKTLGMRPILTFRKIILPQAIRVIVPPLGNQFNQMLKTTSLLSVIGVGEMFRVAEQMQAESYRTFEVYLGISVYYLALTGIWTLIQMAIERRLRRGMRPVTETRNTAARPMSARPKMDKSKPVLF